MSAERLQLGLDYSQFYNLEKYLFGKVGPRFRETGRLSEMDFYLIVRWKANRATSKTVCRLKATAGSFGLAVQQVAGNLRSATSNKDRLAVLMRDWGFRLPMATAILAVLFPTQFGIYDIRVCGELEEYNGLGSRKYSDALWKEYLNFLAAVRGRVQSKRSLRTKDRYLWGRSLYKDVQRALSRDRDT